MGCWQLRCKFGVNIVQPPQVADECTTVLDVSSLMCFACGLAIFPGGFPGGESRREESSRDQQSIGCSNIAHRDMIVG